MVTAAEITDEKTLRAWLETRPRADAVAIAWRAAARVFPLWARAMGMEWARKRELTALPVLRVSLTSGVARNYPTPEVRAAARAVDAAAASAAARAVVAFDADADAFDAAAADARAAAAVAARAAFADADADASAAARAAAAAASAAARAAARAAFAAASAGARAAFASAAWNSIRADAIEAEAGQDLFTRPLWPQTPPEWFTKADAETRAIWKKEPEHWRFWTRWWDSVIAGTPLNPDLLHDIALIPGDIWQKGPGPVAKAIEEIEARYQGEQPEDIEQVIERLPPATMQQRQAFAQAVDLHRDELPSTLEAVLAFCQRELDRLQFRNAPYCSIEEELEAQRQIRVLNTIYAALDRLRLEIPAEGALTPANIEKGEKLSRVYVRAFKEWPRKNAEDIADSAWRAALVGASATLLPMIGVSPNVAVMAGTILFGGKKVADSVKAAKDLVQAPST